MSLGPHMAGRLKASLTHEQRAWLQAQPGSESATLRQLVDSARAGALAPIEVTVHRTLVAALELLAERSSWLRGSPRELLQDLEAGESTALELVDQVCERLRGE